MTTASAVARIVTEDGTRFLEWHCPGCQCGHRADLKPQGRWTLTGDPESAPTLAPSVNYQHPGARCHCFVKAGHIQFLGDCDHALAGQTVPMESME